MAKTQQKIEARNLRKKGLSIITISEKVGVRKSTVSVWCRDIKLTKKQKEKLLKSKIDGFKRGQLIGAELQKNRRLEKINQYNLEGLQKMKDISKNEYFIAGLMLYLGEGARKYNRVIFTNSEHRLVKLMMNWFIDFFGLKKEDFTFWVSINEIHKNRDDIVKQFWINYLNIPPSQFRNTSFVKTKQNKIYENYNNYYGTIHMRILKSSEILYRILGLINGVFESDIIKDKFSRRSSTVEQKNHKLRTRVQLPPPAQ